MKSVFCFCLIGMLLVSCSVLSTSEPTQIIPSEMPTPIYTVTPTIVWFPPTPTYTPFPTQVTTPTSDMRPNIGRVILEDDFSDQSAWTVSQSKEGNVAFGINELTIAIAETEAYLYSIRENPIFTNFYLEITVQPNLCRDVDEYGVLFRVSSSADYYRFSLTCNGQVSLDRVSGGFAYSLQPWIFSGAVPPGALSTSRLGISVVGKEMRFFVNSLYQFSESDPLLTSGGIGIFARSTKKEAVTVNFSDLVVYEVNP